MTRHPRTRSYKKSSSHFSGGKLLMFGLIVVLLLVILWQQKNQAQAPSSDLPLTSNRTQQNAVNTNPHKKINSKPKTPEFDFYTVLPQMQVQSPANNTQNTVPMKPVSNAVVTNSLSPESQTVMPPPVNQGLVTMTPAPENATVATPVEPTKPTLNSTPASSIKNEETDLKANKNLNDTASLNASKNHTEKYTLQVASMRNYHDADQLKAEISMLGLEVSIQKVMIGGEVWYRVHAGSYRNREMALKQQKMLKDHQVSSILVKK